ncbi:MAG: carbohydrate ABC transporter permease [Candidatus Latescibacteria bacterium]|nr:carbohydrate ABC transporter permease [Candidatus Latescibacterota bacterium]
MKNRLTPVHIILIICGIGMFLPFYWMLTTALKAPLEALRFPPTFIPDIFKFSNFIEIFREVALLRYFLNTIFIAAASLIGTLFTSILAAYAFAKFKFWGRDFIFILFLALMMIPLPVYLVPSYMILFRLGWIDTYLALIVPWLVNIFAIFLLRQHIKTLPQDLFDAAKIDGCGTFRTLWQIVVPLSKPVIVTIAIFDIIANWNSFFWPLIVTHSDSIRPLQVGLAYFSREFSTNYPLLMAASTLAILPLVILFFFAQKQIIQSSARTGLKE